MASSLGSSLAPVAGAPRARRGPRASRATSSTASDSSSRLDALLGEDLGDAVRTSLRRRDTAAAIDAAVASLERDSPTDHPVASPLLDGDWKLRYTTSAGTVGSVGAWETFVGAVFDVRQTCARRPDGAGVAITNIVTVRVPAPPAPPMPFPTIPIPDRPVPFASADVRGGGDGPTTRDETTRASSTSSAGTPRRRERRVGSCARRGDASVVCPTRSAVSSPRRSDRRRGARRWRTVWRSADVSRAVEQSRGIVHPTRGGCATVKRQRITHLSERWRVTRDDASYSVYCATPRAKIIYAVVGTVLARRDDEKAA